MACVGTHACSSANIHARAKKKRAHLSRMCSTSLRMGSDILASSRFTSSSRRCSSMILLYCMCTEVHRTSHCHLRPCLARAHACTICPPGHRPRRTCLFILSRTNFSFLLISSSASVAGRTAAAPSARNRSDSAGPRSFPASQLPASACGFAASAQKAKRIVIHGDAQVPLRQSDETPHQVGQASPSVVFGGAFGGASFILAFMLSTASPSPPTFAPSAIVDKLLVPRV